LYKLTLYLCGIQTLDLQYGRALSTAVPLYKEMYWNDKYNKGEDVRFLRFFYFLKLTLETVFLFIS